MNTQAMTPLASLLETEYRGFESFRHVLQQEQEALTAGDVDQLLALAREKSETVVALRRLSENRNQFLASQGFRPRTQPNLALWLSSQGHPTYVPAWEKLLELVHETDHMNRVNGAMIETRLKYNQQALAILQQATQQANLYGRDGQTNALGHGRILGKV